MTFQCAQRNRDLGYFLFETMMLVHGRIEREFYHRERLLRSAHEMKWPKDMKGQALKIWWEDLVNRLAREYGKKEKLRAKVLMIPDGQGMTWELQIGDIPSYPDVVKLGTDPQCVRFSLDPFTRWKTGSWGRNLHAISLCPPHLDDILFLNERGELCETSRSNVFLLIDDTLYTPPISSGLLPGTVRQEILDRGRIQLEGSPLSVREKVLFPQDIPRASSIWVSNALMGIRIAEFV